MNNYFIIGKVNEGKSHLFNLFSKEHKTISNPKENTTVDIIRKQIRDINQILLFKNVFLQTQIYKYIWLKNLKAKIFC